MAVVINTFPDRRAELLGKGLGGIVASVIEARRRKREEEEKRKKIDDALNLLGRATKGEKAEFGPSVTTGTTKRFGEAGPGKAAVTSRRLLPKPSRIPTGADVARPLLGAGVESEFAIKLAQGVDEARQQQEREALEQEELRNVLFKAGGSEELLVSAIAAAKLPADIKLRLLAQTDKLAKKSPEDEEFVGVTAYRLDDGQAVPIRIPERLQGKSVAVVDKYLQDLGTLVTVQPQQQITAAERQFAQDIRTLGDKEDVEHIAAAKRLGLVTVHSTPEGDQIITNLATRETSFTSSPQMDKVAARKIQFRIAAIEETLGQLGVDPNTGRRVPGKGLDLEGGLGLEGFLTAEVGGFIANIWLMDSVLDFMGIEPSEIARAQAARSGFFNVIVPFAEAIATGEGSRDIITSKFGINIATEILLIRELSTSRAGAEQAINRIVKLLTGLKQILEVQLRHGTMLRPKMLNVKWKQLEDNRIEGELELEGK